MCDFEKLRGYNPDVMDFHGWTGYPSDDVWNKFDFETITPPLSPESNNFGYDGENGNACLENSQVDDLLNEFVGFSTDLPDITDACRELFESDFQATDKNNKIKKDCMWNGRTDLKKSNRRSRSNSPGFLSCSPSSGCIDPEVLFNTSGLNDRMRTASPRRLGTQGGPETPSDSEDEVDVVTIEKKSNPSLLPVTYDAVSNGAKVFGKIVQQNGLHSHLALVATSDNNQSKRNKIDNNTNTKTLSMLITNGNRKNGEKKTLQLKCLPLITANVASTNPRKRKLVSTENKPTVLQLMRVAPSQPNSSSLEKENGLGMLEKRRGLSLDGVSMISDTGIHRNTATNKICSQTKFLSPVKNEPVDSASALLAEMKKDKKPPKRSAATLYESPTSSPDSSGGDSPIFPKRRTSGSRSCTSSSGSDEDSIRAAHNVLERQRRESLRNFYHVLRQEVPELAENTKAPKVTILIKAKEHIENLNRINSALTKEKETEELKRRILQQRVRDMVTELTSVNNVSLVSLKEKLSP